MRAAERRNAGLRQPSSSRRAPATSTLAQIVRGEARVDSTCSDGHAARGTSGKVPCRSAWEILRSQDRSRPVHQAAGEDAPLAERSSGASIAVTFACGRAAVGTMKVRPCGVVKIGVPAMDGDAGIVSISAAVMAATGARSRSAVDHAFDADDSSAGCALGLRAGAGGRSGCRARRPTDRRGGALIRDVVLR